MTEETEFGPDDSGTEITVEVGNHMIIRLPENPSTGWCWDKSGLPDLIEEVGDRYEKGPEGGGIGAAAIRVLEFKAKSAGRGILKLARTRSWEGQRSADAQFILNIEVSSHAK